MLENILPELRKGHTFCQFVPLLELERVKINEKLNHFAIKGKIYTKAIQSAFRELQNIKAKNQIAFL